MEIGSDWEYGHMDGEGWEKGSSGSQGELVVADTTTIFQKVITMRIHFFIFFEMG